MTLAEYSVTFVKAKSFYKISFRWDKNQLHRAAVDAQNCLPEKRLWFSGEGEGGLLSGSDSDNLICELNNCTSYGTYLQ